MEPVQSPITTPETRSYKPLILLGIICIALILLGSYLYNTRRHVAIDAQLTPSGVLSAFGVSLPNPPAMACDQNYMPLSSTEKTLWNVMCETQYKDPYIGIYWKRTDLQKLEFQNRVLNNYIKRITKDSSQSLAANFACKENNSLPDQTKMRSVMVDCELNLANATTTSTSTTYATFIYSYPANQVIQQAVPVVVVIGNNENKTRVQANNVYTNLKPLTTQRTSLLNFFVEHAYASGGSGAAGDGGGAGAGSAGIGSGPGDPAGNGGNGAAVSPGGDGGWDLCTAFPWACSSTPTPTTPSIPSGCGPGTLNDTCPPPTPSGCGPGTLNDQCPSTPTPSGCGPGTLNDTCPVFNICDWFPFLCDLSWLTPTPTTPSTPSTGGTGGGVSTPSQPTTETYPSYPSYESYPSYPTYSGPATISSFTTAPRSVEEGGLVNISWVIYHPTTGADACKITAEVQKPASCDATCQSSRNAEQTALNTTLSSGTTNANDPNGGNRNMTAALTQANSATGEYAKGTKSVTLNYSTTFTLSCGTQTTPVKSIIYVTKRHEG